MAISTCDWLHLWPHSSATSGQDRRLRAWWLLLFIFALVPLVPRPTLGESPPRLAVLYPEAARPYSGLFSEIIEGIRERSPGTPSFALTDTTPTAAVRAFLERSRPQAVITLGRAATLAYETGGFTLPQVIGAVDLSPQTRPRATGVSLAVEPTLLFETLKRLTPRIERVWVVFDPATDRWLIERAEHAAGEYGLTLMARPAQDVPTAARRVLDVLRTTDPGRDALWLLAGALVDLEIVLPAIIQHAWVYRLVVFSNHPAHVDRGVLFALYPDTVALGRQLAEQALQLAADPAVRPGIVPLRTVKRAINVRIAAHLDLPLDRTTRQWFDLLLPAP